MDYELASLGEVLIDFSPSGYAANGGGPLFQQNLGGAPCNVACAIAKLGRRSAFLGMAGDDAFGRFCVNSIRGMGVDVRGLKLSPDYNTTLAFVHLSESGERSFSFYRRDCADIHLKKEDLDMEIIRGARIFHFGAVSLTGEPSRSTTIYAVQEAKKSGAVISFDPNLRLNLWESAAEVKTVVLSVFPYVDVIKLSDDEVTFLFDTKDYAAAIEHIRQRFGTKLTLVTRGALGALTVAGGRLYDVPAYGLNIIDTTGTGDCFFAGALHCILSYQKPADTLTPDEISHMLEFANASGALAGTKLGAVTSLPSAADIEHCMKNCRTLRL